MTVPESSDELTPGPGVDGERADSNEATPGPSRVRRLRAGRWNEPRLPATACVRGQRPWPVQVLATGLFCGVALNGA